MLRLLPFCFILTSCGLLKVPARIVNQAGSTTKRAVASTQKWGKDMSNKYFKKDKKEEASEDGQAKIEQPTVALPEEDPYVPAPVRNTVFIPDQPTAPGAPTAPVPDPPAPSVPAAPPLPSDVKLPELPPIEVPE